MFHQARLNEGRAIIPYTIMKYEQSFTLAELDINEVGYLCPSIMGVINRQASNYNREVCDSQSLRDGLIEDIRTAIAQVMDDFLADYVDNHIDSDSTMQVIADTIEYDDTRLVATSFTIMGNEKPVDLSIAREIFSGIDHDELMAAIEDEFLDNLIVRVKSFPRRKEAAATASVSDADTEVASPEPIAEEAAEPIHDEALVAAEPIAEIEADDIDWCDDEEAVEEVVAEEVEEPDFHGIVSRSPIDGIGHIGEEAPAAVAPIAEEPIANAPVVPDGHAQAEPEGSPSVVTAPSPIANLTDPEGLLTKYRANFNDICSCSEVQGAQSNVMSREGNNIVLTSTIIDEPGYKLVTVTKYDAKNKGKQCRTTENDGRDTHLWSWRTPSLYAWAMQHIAEDGSFPDEVLGAALVEKGAGSCKSWGVRFLPTPKEVRNANRGRSTTSKDAAKPQPTAPTPSVPSSDASLDHPDTVRTPSLATAPNCEWWYLGEDYAEYFYLADTTADTCLVVHHVPEVVGYEAETECQVRHVDGEHDGKKGARRFLRDNSFTVIAADKVPADVEMAVSACIEQYNNEQAINEKARLEAEAKAAEEARIKAEIERKRKEAEAKAEAERKAREEAERKERERIAAEAATAAAEAAATVPEGSPSGEITSAPAIEDEGEPMPHLSQETLDFLRDFTHNADFRKAVLKMVRERAKDAERAKAEEEARARRGKGRLKHKMFDEVMRRLRHNKPAYLYGEAGTGKNVLAEQCAEALGIPFAPINCLFEKFEVTGFARPDGTLQETTIYLAVKYGWLLFWDEADTSAPQAGNVMNSLLANGYIDFPVVGRVYAHPNFRCIAAGNTNGRGGDGVYTGRTTLDGATLNRFRLYEIDYDRNVELAIAKKRGYGEQEVDFIEDVRQAVKECGIQHLVSYRQLDDMLDDLEDGQSIDVAISAVLRDMPKDDYPTIAQKLRCGRNKYCARLHEMADGVKSDRYTA